MTCSLNIFGKVDNLNNIIKFFNAKDAAFNDENDRLLTRESDFVQKPAGKIPSSKSNQLDWSNDWLNDDAHNESDEDVDQVKAESKPVAAESNEGWLDSLLVSVSPCGNLAVLAKMQTMLILRGRRDSTGQLRFQYESKVRIDESEKEFITAVICIPIAAQKKTGDGLPEWTCIIAGFNTGNIRIFSENGTLLTNQMFHDDTILKLKCRTHEPAKYIGWISQPEEIEILYANNVLVCIDGLGLYQFLKAARVFSSKSNDLNEMHNMLASLNLDYKKWKLDNQELITDFVSAGLTSENRFDQLFTASTIGGPNEKFESIPPVSNRYLTCGNMPYVCFYHAMEGLAPTVLSDVAKQVAGRVTSAFMNAAKGWMGFNKQPQVLQQKPKPKIELPTPLPARFGLPDYRRNGESIIISPANNLAATSDSFGRVMLIDVTKGIAIRVFKGYRDAQVAWFCVDDESEEKVNKRYALYLVIYAPRRGLLEVWGCQQGIRVAAFNVGKNAKLFYPGYSMLSLNGSLQSEDVKHSIQCYLISEDGFIKTLQIPFHLILSDKSNQRVRDTILLKKIKFILRENSSESEQLWSSLITLLRDFKTPSIKQQALERLTNTGYLSVSKIFDVISHELELIEKNSDGQSNDSNKLAQLCEFYHKLLKSYMFLGDHKPAAEPVMESSPVKEDEKAMADIKSTDHSEFLLKSLSSFLKLDETDLANYFEIRKTVGEKKVLMGFEEKDTKSLSLPRYLSKFELSTAGISSHFHLSKSISLDDKQQLGYFLFKNFFADGAAYDEEYLLDFLRIVPIRKLELLELLVHAWLDDRFSNNVTMFKVVSALCGSTTGVLQSQSVKFAINSTESEGDSLKEPVADEEDSLDVFVNEYLPRLRWAIETNSSILESLYLTWILRSILVQIEADPLLIESFSVLSNRLFSLAKFYRLLLCGDKYVFGYYIAHEWFTLRNILSKSKGILSEIMAKHCILNEFSPKLLNIIDQDEDDLAGSDKEDPKAPLSDSAKEEAQIRKENLLLLEDETNKELYDCLQETRNFLPKSLESDTLLVNCAWEAIELFDSNNSASSGIKYLDLSLRHCGEIGNAISKQGILSMMWHSQLCKRVSKLADLIDKVGKAPKERYLLKEVGITEDSLIKFLECIMTFLDLIMDANCSINEVPIFNHDQFWKGGDANWTSEKQPTTPNIPEPKFFSFPTNGKQTSSTSSASTSSNKLLVEVASEQKPINYHLCLFHYQLIRILYLIVKYNMKSIKPYAFFDTKGRNALFSELYTHPLITNDVDIKILNARKLFLTRVMNSMLEDVEQPTSIKSKLPKETVDHLNIVFNLSKDLGVDLEFIKRYYCCVLYAFDYHSEAEKVLQSVRERELIASQLLVVVGNKINEILKSNFDASLMAILSTNLRSWLKSLGSPEYRTFTIASKQPLLELMGSILDKLPESFSEHKLATELFDFIDNPQFQIK